MGVKPLKLNSDFIGIVKTLFFVCVGMCIRICIYSCTLMQSDDVAVITIIKVNGAWPLGLRAALRKQDCVKTTWNLLQNAAKFLSYGNRQAVVKEGSWSVTPTPGNSAAETSHRSASGDVS